MAQYVQRFRESDQSSGGSLKLRVQGPRDSAGQAVLEYIVILLAVTLAASWAAASVKNRVTSHAENIEQQMRYIF